MVFSSSRHLSYKLPSYVSCPATKEVEINDSLDFRPQSLNLLQSHEENIEISAFKEAPLRFVSLNSSLRASSPFGGASRKVTSEQHAKVHVRECEGRAFSSGLLRLP